MCVSPGHGGKMFFCPKCNSRNPLVAKSCIKCKYVFKEEDKVVVESEKK